MNCRTLGKTGLAASEIGLGTEFLAKNQPPHVVGAVIQAAIDGGINYFDVLVMDPAFLQAAGAVFRQRRGRVIITGHFGTGIVDGKATRVRKVADATASFDLMLGQLGVDSVDIAMLQYVAVREYPKFNKPGGLIEALKAVKDEGKARFLGISSHDPPVLVAAMRSGVFDVIMTQVNAACSALPERRAVLEECASTNIGLVAIKPLLGGKLFQPGKKARIASYQTAREAIDIKVPPGITPARCISHVLAQPGVTVCLAGMQTVDEVQAALQYCTARPAERDDAPLVSLFR